MKSSFPKEDFIDGFSIFSFKTFENLKSFESGSFSNFQILRDCKSSSPSSSSDETTIDETSPIGKHKLCKKLLTKSARDLKTQFTDSSLILNKKCILDEMPKVDDGDSSDTVEDIDDDDNENNNLVICEEINEILAANESSQLNHLNTSELSNFVNNEIKIMKPDIDVFLPETYENVENICLNVEKGKRHHEEYDNDTISVKHIKREDTLKAQCKEKLLDEELSVEAFIKLEKLNKMPELQISTCTSSIIPSTSPLIKIKKEKLTKLRVQTPDDCVILDSGNESNHSTTPNYYNSQQRNHKKYTNIFVAGGKELVQNALLFGCARTELIYKKLTSLKDKQSWKHEWKEGKIEIKVQKNSPRTNSRHSSHHFQSSHQISPVQAEYRNLNKNLDYLPFSLDRLPPFKPPAMLPHQTASPHRLPNVAGMQHMHLPSAQSSLVMPSMPGWNHFEQLLTAQLAANQELLSVQQGLNERFLQDGAAAAGVGLRPMPILGTNSLNLPIGLPPTLTLRTEMHQHQHLHHHQHLVPAPSYAAASALPSTHLTGPTSLHTIQSSIETPLYFQHPSDLFSGNLHSRTSLSNRGAFIPMAENKTASMPASQLLASLRNANQNRPAFKGRWCSAHMQLAWRIYFHTQQMNTHGKQASSQNSFKSDIGQLLFKPESIQAQFKNNVQIPFKPDATQMPFKPEINQIFKSDNGHMSFKHESSNQHLSFKSDAPQIQFNNSRLGVGNREGSFHGLGRSDWASSSHGLPPLFTDSNRLPPMDTSKLSDQSKREGLGNYFQSASHHQTHTEYLNSSKEMFSDFGHKSHSLQSNPTPNTNGSLFIPPIHISSKNMLDNNIHRNRYDGMKHHIIPNQYSLMNTSNSLSQHKIHPSDYRSINKHHSEVPQYLDHQKEKSSSSPSSTSWPFNRLSDLNRPSHLSSHHLSMPLSIHSSTPFLTGLEFAPPPVPMGNSSNPLNLLNNSSNLCLPNPLMGIGHFRLNQAL